MARLILLEVVLFALPFLAFAAWTYVRRGEGEEERPLFEDAPTFWLTVIGLVAMVIGFLSFSTIERYGTDVIYEPAHMEDGRLVPGRAVPRDGAGRP